jgi:hypothetical protein
MKRNRILNQLGVVFVTCLFLLLSSQMAIAATYYIDYNAGDDSNNGKSTSTPWKYSPGMSHFTGSYSHSAGDVFVFKGGVTWAATGSDSTVLTIGNSGGSGNPDIYMGGQQCAKTGSVSCNGGTAWGIGYPVFDGGALNGMLGIYASAKSYITLDGFKIQNVGYTDGSGQAIFFGSGSGLTVKNCLLEPNGVNAFAYGVSSGTYSAIYFHDNIIKKAGRVHITVGDARITDVKYYNNIHYGGYDYDPKSYHTDGLMIGGDGKTDYAIQGLYIYNNKWTGDWSRGATAQLYLNGTPMYCYDYTNGSHEPTPGQVAIGETSGVASKIYSTTNSGGWTGSGTGTICGSSNALINGENLNESPTYGGQYIGTIASASNYTALKSTKDVYIYNNLFATENTTGSAFSPGAIDISAGHSDIKIYNNTIDARSNTAIPMSHCVFIGAFVNNIDIQNNILTGCDNGVTLAGTTTGKVTIDYNLYYTLSGNHLIWDNRVDTRCNTLSGCQDSPVNQEAHGITRNPKFVALPGGGVVGSGNWSLQNDSPAVNKGANLSAFFTTDIFDIPRSGKWNIGAYNK